MKKFLAALLATVMVFNFGCVAFAANSSSSSKSFFNCGDGRYIDLASTRTALTNYSDVIEATPTKTDGILWIEESLYLVETTDSFYTLAEKVRLNSHNSSANETIYYAYNIPEKLQKDIAENIARENANGNLEFSVDLYVPPRASGQSTQELTYTTENGHKCKDYVVTYSNCRTEPVDKNGKNAKSHADALINFTLSAAGCASVVVGLFGAGKSAYDLFVDLFGSVPAGTQDDLTYTLLVYDKKTKDTFYYNPYIEEWEEGCFSYFVQMKRNDTYQYYGANGNSYLWKTDLSTKYTSEHYYDPEFAVLSAPVCYIDAPISIELYGTSFRA